MNTEPAITYWVLPAPADEARLQVIIDALTQTQKAPRFPPHMTLGTLAQPVRDLSSVLKHLPAFSMTPSDICETEYFTKALFLRFEAKPRLRAARAAFEALPGFIKGRAFDPHLSLCYGTPPIGAGSSAAIEAVRDRPVRFNRLAAVQVTRPVISHDQVRAWNVLDVLELSAG
ncbi:MAG: hypothetical protein AAF767_01590 [Pseudomonadota bacterium]